MVASQRIDNDTGMVKEHINRFDFTMPKTPILMENKQVKDILLERLFTDTATSFTCKVNGINLCNTYGFNASSTFPPLLRRVYDSIYPYIKHNLIATHQYY